VSRKGLYAQTCLGTGVPLVDNAGMSGLYAGLISGTSVDGVDAVLARFGEHACDVLVAETTPYPRDLRARIEELIGADRVRLAELGAVDVAVGRFFAACALDLMRGAGIAAGDVKAIGCHGQTVHHAPEGTEPFSLQIGDPNSIAAMTGVTTVADFRRLDVAYGGQGAPLAPAFHEWLLGSPDETRAVLNIGGISNVTILDPQSPALGFDIGPGNTLLDHWVRTCRGDAFDTDGAWAASGRVDALLLERLLDDAYFARRPPKSTGRELFNARWLDARLAALGRRVAAQDVQATLAELTARTIADALAAFAPRVDRLIVCGGGAHNRDLMQRIARLCPCPAETSASYGLAPDWVEGAAFAWLAHARLEALPGNIPTVTGARRAVVLGGVYYGSGSETRS
jgi:anhydro-N-acetylmuramic acid kinase